MMKHAVKLSILAFAISCILASSAAETQEKQVGCDVSKEFRGLAHCIKKRNIQYCSEKGCNLCKDSTCQTTCIGPMCTVCPAGDCCDGKNCNICLLGECCETESCNNCVHECSEGCANDSCKGVCVQDCKRDPQLPVQHKTLQPIFVPPPANPPISQHVPSTANFNQPPIQLNSQMPQMPQVQQPSIDATLLQTPGCQNKLCEQYSGKIPSPCQELQCNGCQGINCVIPPVQNTIGCQGQQCDNQQYIQQPCQGIECSQAPSIPIPCQGTQCFQQLPPMYLPPIVQPPIYSPCEGSQCPNIPNQCNGPFCDQISTIPQFPQQCFGQGCEQILPNPPIVNHCPGQLCDQIFAGPQIPSLPCSEQQCSQEIPNPCPAPPCQQTSAIPCPYSNCNQNYPSSCQEQETIPNPPSLCGTIPTEILIPSPELKAALPCQGPLCNDVPITRSCMGEECNRQQGTPLLEQGSNKPLMTYEDWQRLSSRQIKETQTPCQLAQQRNLLLQSQQQQNQQNVMFWSNENPTQETFKQANNPCFINEGEEGNVQKKESLNEITYKSTNFQQETTIEPEPGCRNGVCTADTGSESTVYYSCFQICNNQCRSLECFNICKSSCISPSKLKPPIHENSSIVIETVSNFNNKTYLDTPIYINNTNVNHIKVFPNYTETVLYPQSTTLPPVESEEVTESKKEESLPCCEVVHPITCEKNFDDFQCTSRRHTECSNICSGPYVHIVKSQTRMTKSECHQIKSYPYYYCGKYKKHDCSECYNCTNGNTYFQCSSEPECPQECRINFKNPITATKSYNTNIPVDQQNFAMEQPAVQPTSQPNLQQSLNTQPTSQSSQSSLQRQYAPNQQYTQPQQFASSQQYIQQPTMESYQQETDQIQQFLPTVEYQQQQGQALQQNNGFSEQLYDQFYQQNSNSPQQEQTMQQSYGGTLGDYAMYGK